MAAISEAAKAARERFPQSGNRINAALRLVYDGKVTPNADGTYSIVPDTGDGPPYEVKPSGGICSCQDWSRAPEHYCKHRFAVGLWVRGKEYLPDTSAPEAGVDEERAASQARMGTSAAVAEGDLPLPDAPPARLPECLRDHLVYIKGKPFVQYAGLLAYAQSQGLQALEATLLSVTSELAVATATARFADGRCYSEAADATPQNVGSGVRPHFPRVALTRAKGRALRDALGVTIVMREELED
jgi:hypothetical protein